MPRKIVFLKYSLSLAIALLFLSAAGYYLFFQPRPSSLTTLETIVPTRDGNSKTKSGGTVSLHLFYSAPSSSPENHCLLVEEKKPIKLFPQPERLALEALKELALPSPSGIPPALPQGAIPLNVFFIETDLAVVNYNRWIQQNLAGGIEAELSAIYAIVHTITFNFPKISSVRLLIEGEEQETLGGHFGIAGNLQSKLSLIQDYQNPYGSIRVEPLPP